MKDNKHLAVFLFFGVIAILIDSHKFFEGSFYTLLALELIHLFSEGDE